jgi:hypothetical protein
MAESKQTMHAGLRAHYSLCCVVFSRRNTTRVGAFKSSNLQPQLLSSERPETLIDSHCDRRRVRRRKRRVEFGSGSPTLQRVLSLHDDRTITAIRGPGRELCYLWVQRFDYGGHFATPRPPIKNTNISTWTYFDASQASCIGSHHVALAGNPLFLRLQILENIDESHASDSRGSDWLWFSHIRFCSDGTQLSLRWLARVVVVKSS